MLVAEHESTNRGAMKTDHPTFVPRDLKTVLAQALHGVARAVRERTKSVPHELWDQSVFRFVLAEQVLLLCQPDQIETEWNDVSLMIRLGSEAALVETKWFLVRRTLHREDAAPSKKGRPSSKNFEAVVKALERLEARAAEQRFRRGTTVLQFLALAYSPEYAPTYSGLGWVASSRPGARGTEVSTPAVVRAKTIDGEVDLTFRLVGVSRAG